MLGKEQARRNDLQAFEERRELIQRVTVHPGRRAVHAEEPIRDLAIAAAHRDDDIAAWGKQPDAAGSQFRCRHGVEEMQDRAHDQAGWDPGIALINPATSHKHRSRPGCLAGGGESRAFGLKFTEAGTASSLWRQAGRGQSGEGR
jgi:hypothetical protein